MVGVGEQRGSFQRQDPSLTGMRQDTRGVARDFMKISENLEIPEAAIQGKNLPSRGTIGHQSREIGHQSREKVAKLQNSLTDEYG